MLLVIVPRKDSSLEEYLALVYSKKKQGFGKAAIAKVSSRQPAPVG